MNYINLLNELSNTSSHETLWDYCKVFIKENLSIMQKQDLVTTITLMLYPRQNIVRFNVANALKAHKTLV